MELLDEYLLPVFKCWFGSFENKEKKWEYLVSYHENILKTCLLFFILSLFLYIGFDSSIFLWIFLYMSAFLCLNFFKLNDVETRYNGFIQEEEEEYAYYQKTILENLKILGIHIYTTDITEIKKAYKSLMLKYHPDRITGNEEKAKEINTAYEELKKLLNFN